MRLRNALAKELGVMEGILPDVARSLLVSLYRDAKQEFPKAR